MVPVCMLGCASADDPLELVADVELELVADVELPGAAVRFDYQDIDIANGHLIIAHMNDDSVDVVDLGDGSTVKELADVPTARGVVVAPEIGMFFVTASGNQVVGFDSVTLTEVRRTPTGASPDGVGWDGVNRIVGVSDQRDGALSLIADAGAGERTQVTLGDATGNVIYDATRGWFWIAVEHEPDPDQLIAVDPVTATVQASLDLPGCSAAHGVRLHPDGQSAFVACEDNAVLARVDLTGSGEVTTGATTDGPDVLAIDPDLGWLYVAAEAGDLSVYDITEPGVSLLFEQDIGDEAHTVAVDPATHHVFFPLQAGADGSPVLRIMRPLGLEDA